MDQCFSIGDELSTATVVN